MVVETKKKIMMQKLLFFLIFKETQPNKTKTSKIKINLFETLRINIFISDLKQKWPYSMFLDQDLR
jgi:hypothetical protein